jgi:hypothetical protein
VHVAFTPAETAAIPTAIVVDVIRATSTIVQAVASGYRRVLCCAEIEEAKALRDELGNAVLAGERKGQPIPGFDLGNSPLEFLEPRAETLVLTTTNGTRAIVEAASRCDLVLVGSLLNLDAVATAAAERGKDVEIVCAGLLAPSPWTMPTVRDGSLSVSAARGPTRLRRRCASPSPSPARKRRFGRLSTRTRAEPRRTSPGALARAPLRSSRASSRCAGPRLR